ncbi:MAG: Lrp/AsnC family transcriptional regulator [Candidatus Lokiarchaeota archaeon]|nr:Lrp/AsnC family transcriptional regulator [Candidatus Lokiarchaeota archaeon]
MNNLDFQILKILDKNCRISYSEVANNLDVSVRSVSRRVDLMIQDGVIERFKVNFNYNRLGFRQHIVFLRPPPYKSSDEFFKDLQGIPEIERIWQQLDGSYTFTLFSKDAKHIEEINVALLKIGANLTGRAEVRMHLPSDIPFSRLDWKIIYQLLDNSRVSIGDIAAELGVSEKTISRRLKRFDNMRLVKYTPVINFEAITEMSTGIASFETIGPSKAIYENIKKEQSLKYWRIAGSVSPSIVLFLYGKNISEIYLMYERIASRNEIKNNRLSIVVKNCENSPLVRDTIRKIIT